MSRHPADGAQASGLPATSRRAHTGTGHAACHAWTALQHDDSGNVSDMAALQARAQQIQALHSAMPASYMQRQSQVCGASTLEHGPAG